uniref:Uncharacterized protein n=1 Tax=Sinocyclocheilus anshuiensis TaxID=1608454 RepID=A0A671KIH7_9TELE
MCVLSVFISILEFHLERTPLLTSPHPAELTGSTPSRSAGFLGTSSPGPMADLYGTANQDSISSYISAASPAPSTGFSHSLGVSQQHAVLILLTKTNTISKTFSSRELIIHKKK